MNRDYAERVNSLLVALAWAQRDCDDGSSLDEAFVWEPTRIERRPTVTFGMLREARALVEIGMAAARPPRTPL